jgi:hypothetical protein
MSTCAPVLLFVYCRLDHVKKTVEALQRNSLAESTDLIVYADAPAKVKDELSVNGVRDYVKSISGFKSVELIFQQTNKGLAKSIVEGVTEQVNKYGKVIVLEDDLITSPYFLEYMNDALNRYEGNSKVMQVSGYNFPISGAIPETFFLQLSSSWGWATWKESWSKLSMDTSQHIADVDKRNAVHRFNIEDGIGFYNHLLDNQSGVMNTWAVKWYASIFLQDGLCLYPSKTLVKNIGHDGSGENSLQNDAFAQQIVFYKRILVDKIALVEDAKVRKKISVFLQRIHGVPSPLREFKNKIRDKIRYEFRKLFGRK